MEEDILNYSVTVMFWGHPVYSHKISRIKGMLVTLYFYTT